MGGGGYICNERCGSGVSLVVPLRYRPMIVNR